MNVIPCVQETFVVYGVEDANRVIDLTECPVIAWELEAGVLSPIPADQMFAEENYDGLRIGNLYYGEFTISGLSREKLIEYLDRKLQRKLAKKAANP